MKIQTHNNFLVIVNLNFCRQKSILNFKMFEFSRLNMVKIVFFIRAISGKRQDFWHENMNTKAQKI